MESLDICSSYYLLVTSDMPKEVKMTFITQGSREDLFFLEVT